MMHMNNTKMTKYKPKGDTEIIADSPNSTETLHRGMSWLPSHSDLSSLFAAINTCGQLSAILWKWREGAEGVEQARMTISLISGNHASMTLS